MAEETAFGNGRISNFQGLMTLTVNLDRVILHNVVHRSLTSNYMPNYTEIKETLWMDGRRHLRPTLLGRLRKVHLKNRSRDPTTPITEQSVIESLALDIFYLHTKYGNCHCSRYGDICGC